MIEVADTNEALSADAINSTVPCATKKPIAITFSLLAKRGFHCYWVFSPRTQIPAEDLYQLTCSLNRRILSLMVMEKAPVMVNSF